MDYTSTRELPIGDGLTNAYISIYLQMDDSYKESTRNVYTFLNAFSDTGGLMTVIYLITTIII
jgi:hypothetical protein